MISRKEKIVREALALFSTQGFVDTSTKLIAKNAGVSEALIFKHFKSKDALLSHIIRSGYQRIIMEHKGMLTYKGPKDFIRRMLYLPNKLVSDAPQFWKLQERLSHHSFSRAQHDQFMKPVRPVIKRAFKELNYEDPKLETELLIFIIDMLWKREASGEIKTSVKMAHLLALKYDVEP
ncbi:MAG TPA: TetR/AcrR family transcriptional regulator [Sphingobacterium sp.]|nr:TetR/AcrR family transcriptional regulator [Sphingobacterium sp.]